MRLRVDRARLEALPPADRREAERLLLELESLREENPLQFVKLYPKQEAFCASRAFRKAFFGGNGAGKTHIGIVDDLIQLVDRECLPERLQRLKRWEPPFYLRIVAPKLANIEGTILEKFRELTPKSQFRGGSLEKAYDKVNRKLRFANGSYVLFNTGDQDRDAHSGVRLHRVHFDEEPEGEHGRGIYVENVMRLRDFMPEAQVMFTMTPLFGMSWTYDEVYMRRTEPDVFCVVASMLDNVFLPDREGMLRQVEHLPERERQAIIEGKFVNFHGHVLENFRVEGEPDSHVVPAPSPQHVRSLDKLVCFDPGVARGGVVFLGFDRDNVCLVFDELYPKDMTVPQVVAAVRGKLAAWGIPEDEVQWVIDPSARNRVLTNADSVESLLMREGVFPVAGQNDRQAGILQMRARLEANALLVSRECRAWLFEANRWLVAEDEESGKGSAAGFKTKGPDHLMDPTRYGCMERLWYADMVPERMLSVPAWVPGQALSGRELGAFGSVPDAPPMGAMG